MNPAIEHTLAGLMAVVGGVIGSQAIPTALAQTPAHDWMTQLQGPFGALVGLSIGLYWMKTRLDKAEAKNDKREEERDEDRKNLITVVTQNSIIMNRSSDVLERTGELLEEAVGVIKKKE